MWLRRTDKQALLQWKNSADAWNEWVKIYKLKSFFHPLVICLFIFFLIWTQYKNDFMLNWRSSDFFEVCWLWSLWLIVQLHLELIFRTN